METIDKIENTIGGWLKPLPQLPVTWKKWIADNIWWITLVSVILSVLVIFTMINALLIAFSVISAVTGFYGQYFATTYSAWWETWSVIALAVMIAVTVIEAIAITPLKNKQRRGWDMLFLAYLIGAAETIVTFVRDFNIITFIPSVIAIVIGLGVGAYLLFEVRSYFKSIS